MLPVYHTESDVFRTFTSRLVPRLIVIRRNFYRKKIAEMYLKKKITLKKYFEGGEMDLHYSRWVDHPEEGRS